MGAGRPYHSMTPPWRSKPAVKVRMYLFLCMIELRTPTAYGCVKEMRISRTTAIKWFDAMRWDEDQLKRYWVIKKWVLGNYGEKYQYDAECCAKDLGYDLDEVRIDIEMMKIEPQYIWF